MGYKLSFKWVLIFIVLLLIITFFTVRIVFEAHFFIRNVSGIDLPFYYKIEKFTRDEGGMNGDGITLAIVFINKNDINVYKDKLEILETSPPSNFPFDQLIVEQFGEKDELCYYSFLPSGKSRLDYSLIIINVDKKKLIVCSSY